MSIVNIASASQNLNKLISDVNLGYNPITIVNSSGEGAVLISEKE